ncbi:MAG: glutathione S-transferase family protein, partial [Planktomarina sp.]|nr:glutathione S-transferase family protein [Planktomarina sp.]
LELSGLDWQPVFVDFFSGQARTDAYRSLNIMAEAPVLEQGDFTLSQSGALQQWEVDQTGKLGGAPEDKYEVLRWVLFDNHKMSSQAGITRFLMNFLAEDKRPQEAIKFIQGRLLGAFKTLDSHLSGRNWIVGQSFTIADIANCGYLFYPEPYGFIRSDWPNIDAWLSRIEATPGWKHPYDLMPGNPSDRA